MNGRTYLVRKMGAALVVVFALLMTGIVGVAAQAGQPILIGQNQTGEITAGAAAISYTLSIGAAQNVSVQVFSITTGFQPALIVLDPSGIALAQSSGSGTGSVALPVTLGTPGAYTLVVGTANGQPGQFLISVQPGAALTPPTPLQPGTPASSQVTATDALRAFSFTGLAGDAVVISVTGAPGAITGPVVRLKDALSGETLALSGARMIGASFRVPAGAVNYIIEIAHGGSAGIEAFTVCASGISGGVACPAAGGGVVVVPNQAIPTQVVIIQPPAVATAVPTQFRPVSIPANGACSVASSQGSTINVRSAPTTTSPTVAQLPNNQIALVTGRLPDGSWYQVNFNGISGWISGSVVTVGGLCAAVPSVVPTPVGGNPVIPTLTPSATLPGPTATATATLTPTLPPTAVPATLNFSLPANFGTTSLTSGFVPDPFTRGMTSGGSVDVSYLGGGCRGFATSAPDFSVSYTSGAFPLLRFYFVGNGDTTMIINAPNASYFCNDDSFGTLNPTIDFNSPSSGRYDIWIGSFSQGAFVSGTLNVTESNANTP